MVYVDIKNVQNGTTSNNDLHMNAKCVTSTKDYWSLYLIIQTPYAVSAVLFLDNFFVDTDHLISK